MPAKLVKKSLRYSLWDGVFASFQFGTIEQFIIPLALFMGANNFAIGILSFMRNALVSIIQIASADVTKAIKSRKKVLTFCVLMAALLWLPTFLLPFLFKGLRVWVFILLFSITSGFNMFATPAWASLMAEYIPHKKRGAYFGLRASLLGIIYLIGMAFAGIILYWSYSINLFYGFLILIAAAALSRFISFIFLTGMYEPKWVPKQTDYFSFMDFLGRFPKGNFIRFSLLSSLMMFWVSFSSPFIPVYLLKELNANYIIFTILLGAAALTTFIMQRYWGKFADIYGNMKIIKLTMVIVALVPFLWIFSRGYVYLFFIQLFAGFVWAGYNLSSSNFIYDVAVSGKRERCIAYFNFLSGLGLGLGALAGGAFISHLPALLGSKYYSLFFISGLFRLLTAFLIILFVKEVRSLQPVRVRMMLYDLSGIRAIGLLSRELLFRSKSK